MKSERALEKIFERFEATYVKALKQNGFTDSVAIENIRTLKSLALKELSDPTLFEAYHKMERKPFDFYRFGLDFFGPLIDEKASSFMGERELDEIEENLRIGQNAILFANHQTEPDPQIISFMLQDKHPRLAEEMIFVAGHRVTSDPVAIPFSRGRNLICIFSKRHIENDPDQKEARILHNRKAMEKLKSLLKEGGKCIYVAPSGGRDRPNEQNELLPAMFDPASLELFRLMATGTKTRFYPLAMHTYEIMPPSEKVEKELGETREAGFGPVYLAIGQALDLDHFPGMPEEKSLARIKRAEYVYSHVLDLYLRK